MNIIDRLKLKNLLRTSPPMQGSKGTFPTAKNYYNRHKLAKTFKMDNLSKLNLNSISRNR